MVFFCSHEEPSEGLPDEDFRTIYASERTFGQSMLFEICDYCMKKTLENTFARQTLLSLGAKLCYGSHMQLSSTVGLFRS